MMLKRSKIDNVGEKLNLDHWAFGNYCGESQGIRHA